MIKYRIEKEKKIPGINVNIDLQNIIEEIGVNLHKQNLEKSTTVDIVKNSLSNEKEIEEDEEISIPLTPEMEHANTIYHQAMKLINGTTNRQYET
jgi:hypothetical protein